MDAVWILAQRAQIASIEAEVQGMVALNEYRLARGEIMAYDEDAFLSKSSQLMNICNLLLQSREALFS